MSNDAYLHNLRVKFITLNMEYTQALRTDKTMEELKGLRDKIAALESEIEALEKDLKNQ